MLGNSHNDLPGNIADLLERFRRGAEMIAATAAGITGQEADFSPAPGKWSARQIIAHLADTELVAADRFRRTIAEQNPALIAFEQDAWATQLDYASRRINDSLDLLRAVRIANFDLLRALSAETYLRTARHSKKGDITLAEMLKGFTQHTENHAKQIEHAREKFRESRQRG